MNDFNKWWESEDANASAENDDQRGLAKAAWDAATVAAGKVADDLRTCSECGFRYERARGGLCKCGVERLKAELSLWKPLTPEEAERALEEAESVPLPDDRIAEIVKRATDPAESVTNSEQAQLAVRVRNLEAERDQLRAENERLRKILESNADALVIGYEATKERDQLRTAAEQLRAALRALSWRHGWIPQGGPCVCKEHRAAEAALAAAAPLLEPKETP